MTRPSKRTPAPSTSRTGAAIGAVCIAARPMPFILATTWTPRASRRSKRNVPSAAASAVASIPPPRASSSKTKTFAPPTGSPRASTTMPVSAPASRGSLPSTPTVTVVAASRPAGSLAAPRSSCCREGESATAVAPSFAPLPSRRCVGFAAACAAGLDASCRARNSAPAQHRRREQRGGSLHPNDVAARRDRARAADVPKPPPRARSISCSRGRCVQRRSTRPQSPRAPPAAYAAAREPRAAAASAACFQ